MIQPDQVVLFHFPQADLAEGKLRPALLLTQLPGEYDDWLVCMISSQTRHYVADFDEIIQEGDTDFEPSGLKLTSVVRVGRLAAAEPKTEATENIEDTEGAGAVSVQDRTMASP